MTVTIPESITAEGNVKAVFVEAIADLDEPTPTEVNGGVDVSCFLMPDWDGPTATQNTGEDRRFCSRETFSRFGRNKWEMSPLVYTYLPQELGTPGHAANELYEALPPDTTGFLVIAYGKAASAAFVAGDIVDVFPIEAGVQNKQARGTDEFAPLTVTQALGIPGVPTLDAEVTV